MWKNRWYFILSLAVLFYFSVFYDSYEITLITAALFLILPLSGIYTFYICRKISVRFQSEVPIVKKGQLFFVELFFVNTSFFPVSRIKLCLSYWNQFTKNKQNENYLISLNKKCTQKVTCHLGSDYCGNIEFEISDLRVYDPFGIWAFKISVKHSFHVSVLPEMPEIMDSMLREGGEAVLEEEEYSVRRSGDDPSEIFRIREYGEGDKLNRIHWKLSAKEGCLLVKDFGLPIDSSVVILMELYDAGKETEDYIDAVIESAMAFSMQFIRMKQQHFLAWYDELSEQICRKRIVGEEDLYETLGILFQAGIYKDSYMGLAMYQAKYRTEQYSNLFYVTSEAFGEDIFRLREFAKYANCHLTMVMKKEELSREQKEYLLETDIVHSVVRPAMLKEDIEKIRLMPFQEKD